MADADSTCHTTSRLAQPPTLPGKISLTSSTTSSTLMTCVEKATVQYRFIMQVKQQLNANEVQPLRGDVFKFIETCGRSYDFIFADPPYDLPRLPEVPQLVLSSPLVKPGTVFVMEHSRNNDFSHLPYFAQHRAYGSVNFSIFIVPEAAE